MARHTIAALLGPLLSWAVPWAASLPAYAEAPLEAEARVVSWNVRYGSADDGPNRWELRRERVFETLREGDYDFIGLQEALPFQMEEIAGALGGYSVLSRTREVDPATGEACTILYRADRWTLDRREQGTFWLSETPEVAGSKSWDSSLPRIATWGLFHHPETGARLYVFNTHFDHRGEVARLESAALLRERFVEVAGDAPVVVMGDFNAGENSAVLSALRRSADGHPELVDAFRKLHPAATQTYTGNGWGSRTTGEKIDAVLVRADMALEAAEILRPRHEGRAPSDHDPVKAVLRLPLEELTIGITDLEGCRSCAAGIERALGRVDGILRAELHETEPRIVLRIERGREVGVDELRDAIRNAGYTPGGISRP